MSDIIEKLGEAIGGRKIVHDEEVHFQRKEQSNARAEYYIEVDRLEDLILVANVARKLGVPVFILGGGAFVSVPKRQIKGLVIKNNCRRFDKMSMRGTVKANQIGVEEVLVYAESGTIINQLVRFTIEEGLHGIEYQLGLPGTVGGAIFTNAKYKTEFVRDTLDTVRILDKDGVTQTHKGTDILGTPKSQVWEESEAIILSAVFRLLPFQKSKLWETAEAAQAYRSAYQERHR